MFIARAAALRSAALGRQVGAVITTEEGDIVAVGTNEVPKAGGGLYWPGDDGDAREFKRGVDTSTKRRRNLLAQVFERLKSHGWLTEQKSSRDVDDLVEEALALGSDTVMGDAQIMDLLEFGREVHAELAAIVDAARRGVPINNCTLYTTTFPCHNCTKHVVASGISRVVYIEPYPKSLALDLHGDSISVDSAFQLEGHVDCEPFVGVAPSRYIQWFSSAKRKSKDGTVVEWDKVSALPRLRIQPGHTEMETSLLGYLMTDVFEKK